MAILDIFGRQIKTCHRPWTTEFHSTTRLYHFSNKGWLTKLAVKQLENSHNFVAYEPRKITYHSLRVIILRNCCQRAAVKWTVCETPNSDLRHLAYEHTSDKETVISHIQLVGRIRMINDHTYGWNTRNRLGQSNLFLACMNLFRKNHSLRMIRYSLSFVRSVVPSLDECAHDNLVESWS